MVHFLQTVLLSLSWVLSILIISHSLNLNAVWYSFFLNFKHTERKKHLKNQAHKNLSGVCSVGIKLLDHGVITTQISLKVKSRLILENPGLQCPCAHQLKQIFRHNISRLLKSHSRIRSTNYASIQWVLIEDLL